MRSGIYCVIFCAITGLRPGQAATPEILQPEQGAILEIGAEVRIYWSWEELESVSLEFSADSGAYWMPVIAEPVVKAADAGEFGKHTWTVPDRQSDQCLIRMFQESTQEVYHSPVFEIRGLVLTSPSEGATYNPGDTVRIIFSTTKYGDITVEYSTDGGETWSGQGSPGSFSSADPDWGSPAWVAPEVASKLMQVRLYSESFPADTFYSGLFTIKPPLYVTVDSPNGGERYCPGDTIPISWTWYNRAGGDQYHSNVPRLWLDGGTDDEGLFEGQVVHNTAHKDTFWVIPDDERYCTDRALLSVNEYNSSMIDYSDEYFTIACSCADNPVRLVPVRGEPVQGFRWYGKPLVERYRGTPEAFAGGGMFRADGARVGMWSGEGGTCGAMGPGSGYYLILKRTEGTTASADR